MVDIRPNVLPAAILPLRSGDALIVDQGADGVRQTDPFSMTDSVAPVATQVEAVAGADNTKRMTPLRTKQSIASEVGVTLASNTQGAKADSAVQSVNGKSGNSITLDKSDVGLGNVDNTSDANKPISTAQQTALDLKANAATTISAGTGLTGGGSLSADRTVSLNSASIASLAKADSAIQPGDNRLIPSGGSAGQVLGYGDGTVRAWTDAGTGDMSASVYDPSSQASNAFNGFPVATRTAMKAINVSQFNCLYLIEEGREGSFVLKAGSPPVADTQEGVYVVSNTAGYYWERIYAPAMAPTVRAFGAVLDGSTDDSNAIKGAIAVTGIAFIPYTSTGFVAGEVDITPSARHVIRAERTPTWKLGATHAYAIRVKPSSVADAYAYIEKFVFDGSAAPSTSGAILINTSAGNVSGLRCGGIVARDCGFAYREEDSASNFVVDMQFDDVLCFYTRGRQIYSRRSRGFFSWGDIKVDNTYNVVGGRPRVTWNSIYFGDVLGLDFNCMDVVGEVPGSPNNLSYQAGAIGIVIDGVVTSGRGSIYGRRMLVDNTCGPGIQLTNLFNVSIDTIQSYGNLGVPIEMVNVSKSTLARVKAFGGKGVANAAASASGVAMSACTNVILDVLEAENCTGSGNTMVGCADCQVNGGYSVNNTAYGYYDDNTGDRNRRVGVTARGNTAGSLFQDKASHATYSWTPNSGTPTASTIGTITVP